MTLLLVIALASVEADRLRLRIHAALEAGAPAEALRPAAQLARLQRGAPATPAAAHERREAHLLFARVALAAGNLPVAVREARNVLQLHPDDVAARAIAGTALWRLGQPDEALGAYAEACDIEPSLCAVRRSLEAIHALQLEQHDRALQLAPDDAPYGYAEVNRSVRRAALRATGGEPLLWVQAWTTGGYDSNAIYDPEEPDLSAADEQAAALLEIGASAALTPLRLGGHSLGGEISARRTEYFGDTADDFDALGVDAAARYRLRFVGAGRQAVETAYLFSLLTFDGGPLTGEADTHVFVERHGGLLRWTLAHTADEQTWIEARGGWEGYRDVRRVGARWRLTVGESSFWLDGRLKLYLSARGGLDQAELDLYDAWSAGALAGVSTLLPASVGAALRLDYGYRDYHASGDLDVWPEARTDHALSARLSVSRPLCAGLSVELAGGVVRNVSSVPLFDYTKLTTTLGVRGEYRLD